MIKILPEKIFLPALAGCLVFAVLFSAALAFSHIDHDCGGRDCPVCLQIRAAGNLSGSLGAVTLFVPRSFPFKKIISVLSFCPPTSITLKVQSNT
jgi:disulfide bond formation protein DsbB